MKILKPGKVEQRKFVCQKCGCEFAATCTEIEEGVYVRCPQDGCRYGGLEWGDGKPYGEPEQYKRSDLVRLTMLLRRACELKRPASAQDMAEFLIKNGVTFGGE